MRRCVLALFAHPDDEAYGAAGTLGACARRGHRVVVVAATRGEKGLDQTGTTTTPAQLADLRSRELAASCRLLGAEPPRFLDLPDGDVSAHAERGRARLRALVTELEPDVLITHGPDGAYGHVDHIACMRMADGMAVERVLHVAFAPGVFGSVRKALRRVVPELIADADSTDRRFDLEVNLTDEGRQKVEAMSQHRSQLSGGDPFSFLRPGLISQLLETERFRLAAGKPLPPGASGPFDGL